MARICWSLALAAVLAVPSAAWADDLTAGMTKGSADLKSAGPLAFAPEGILLVGDPAGAAVFAIATEDAKGNPEEVTLSVPSIDEKVAGALGTAPNDILINDLAVNPSSGKVYLSVSRGRGPNATPVLLCVDASGKIAPVALKDVKFSKAVLPNPPAPGGEGRSNQRAEAITDLAYADGRVIVAGLSSEEFASTLRSIPFPFKEADKGTGVEIFHGAHGRFETRSPVRTFALYKIGNQPHVLAAYTCTPLVKFPLSELRPGAKVRGTTVAELGNRNRPLDMIVYQDGGKDFVLLANSSRGVMKISTENIDRAQGITEKINDKAGQSYETIGTLKGVQELDRLNKGHAVVLIRADGGPLSLQTVKLP
jgi:hypothetical protein